MIRKRILILICVSCLFSKYLYDEHRHFLDFPLTRALVSQNVYNNSDYFNQNVFSHIDDILIDLQIENESKELPQDSEIKQMEGFEYIEFELLLLDCSFEKFGQFVNRLEKSDKIFIIDGFEFENSIDRGIQRALKSEGVFPGKDISMKIWAINFKKVDNISNLIDFQENRVFWRPKLTALIESVPNDMVITEMNLYGSRRKKFKMEVHLRYDRDILEIDAEEYIKNSPYNRGKELVENLKDNAFIDHFNTGANNEPLLSVVKYENVQKKGNELHRIEFEGELKQYYNMKRRKGRKEKIKKEKEKEKYTKSKLYRFEKNLEKRKAYKFKLSENLSDPTDLSNVVMLPGYEGEYNHAVKRNAMRLSLIFIEDDNEPRVSIDFKGHIYNLKEGDLVDGGIIRKINKNSVEYEKDGKIKTLMPGQN